MGKGEEIAKVMKVKEGLSEFLFVFLKRIKYKNILPIKKKIKRKKRESSYKRYKLLKTPAFSISNIVIKHVDSIDGSINFSGARSTDRQMSGKALFPLLNYLRIWSRSSFHFIEETSNNLANHNTL